MLAGFSNAMALLSGFLVVPSLLFQAGMDFTGAYTAFMLISAVGTILAGRQSAQPLALVPGVAMASWLVYGEIISHGTSWQAVLGASFLASALGFFLWLSPLRRVILEAVPEVLRRSLSVGLGLMLLLQGLLQGRLLVGSSFSVTMLGDLSDPVAFFSLVGILVTLALLANGVPGSLAIGTVATAALSFWEGFWVIPEAPFLLPEGLDRVAFQLDLWEGICRPGILLPILLVVMMDSWGAAAAFQEIRPGGECLSRRLFFCLMGTGAAGALLGSLPPRLAPESAAGIAAGGSERASYATAFFLALLLFCEPVLKEAASFSAIAVPATVGAGVFLLRPAGALFGGDVADAAASLCLVLLMPLSHDVAAGLGIALLVHVALKLFGRQGSSVPWEEAALAALFALYFFFL